MLDSLTLHNFKCFKRLYMPLKPLTLIAGINGAGKSSIIQSLLLIRQSFIDKETDWTEEILVNGALVDSDCAEDLLFVDAEENEPKISICIEDGDNEYSFEMSPETNDDHARVTASDNLSEAKKSLSLLQNDFLYLYADRIDPKVRYAMPKSSKQDSRLGDKKASRSVFRLAQAINSNEQIAIPSLKHDKASDKSILRNVSAWINYIMGANLEIKAEETQKDSEARYIYTITNQNGEQKNLSPLNVPFGSNYLLPIVLGVMTAPVGSLMLIENPESHLHPAAQGRVGELLSRCAEAGVQIIVETHSDHLMNGVRYACKKKLITNEKVEMDLICEDAGNSSHIRKHIELNSEGHVIRWIPGFFDEWEKALIKMLPD